MNRYREALGWLFALEAAKGMDFKLERVELALASLGAPHLGYPTVHVAGTNGKGSVAAMIHSVLCEAGYAAALYTSPHLVRFTERIRLADEEISEDSVVDLVDEIRAKVTSRAIDLTFFEFTTVMAFLYFQRRNADVAVVEVGLGGRLDATNVIEPEVALVTSIGLDHQEWLGNSLAEIAAEKGGILKSGTPAVFGALQPEAGAVLERMAAERGCAVWRQGRDFGLRGDPLEYVGPAWRIADLEVPLRGLHQRDNAAVAIAGLERLSSRLPLDPSVVRRGLRRTRWPGRLEVVLERPLVVLDGAHNIDGVAALVREMREIARDRRVRLLFAVMQDKDWRPMVDGLAEIADEVVVTSVAPPRGESPMRLAEAFRARRPARIGTEPAAALAEMVAESSPDDVVLVAGSLFLVGAVRPTVERLRHDAAATGRSEVARG